MATDIFDVLLTLAPTVLWLNEFEPVNMQDVPKEHSTKLKQLENLGLVYRRNSHSCGLQRRRLIRLLTIESSEASAQKRLQCQTALASIWDDKVPVPTEAR